MIRATLYLKVNGIVERSMVTFDEFEEAEDFFILTQRGNVQRELVVGEVVIAKSALAALVSEAY